MYSTFLFVLSLSIMFCKLSMITVHSILRPDYVLFSAHTTIYLFVYLFMDICVISSWSDFK